VVAVRWDPEGHFCIVLGGKARQGYRGLARKFCVFFRRKA